MKKNGIPKFSSGHCVKRRAARGAAANALANADPISATAALAMAKQITIAIRELAACLDRFADLFVFAQCRTCQEDEETALEAEAVSLTASIMASMSC